MKKRFNLVMFIIVMLMTIPCTLFAGGYLSIIKSPQIVLVDGNKTSFEIYNINGNNYFKLRDIAYILNGSPVQFSLAYDDNSKMISIVKGESYVTVGGEMSIGEDKSSTAVKSNQSIKIDGIKAELLAYNLGGNNFFQLRALADALGFGAEYDADTNSVLISTSTSLEEDSTITEEISETFSEDSIITLTTYNPTNAFSTVGYKIGNTTYLDSLTLGSYNDIFTEGDILNLQFLLEANKDESITIKAYCNGFIGTKSSSALTNEYTFTNSKYTPILVTVDKKALLGYCGLAENMLYIMASNSSGNTVTLYSGTISTPMPENEGNTTSSEFSLVKGINGSNVTNSYKYAGGKAYAVEYYFTLKTGDFGGNYTMSFPTDDDTDVCSFTVESNSVYEIKYVYAISDSQIYNYKYDFNVSLSGPKTASLSYLDTHPGKISKGAISVKKI